MDTQSPVSRRSALRLIAVLPAVLAGAAPVLASAQSIDALKAQYHYQKMPHNRQKCFGCANYARRTRVVGTCRVLDTDVNWEGWCTAWSAKTT